MNYKEWIDQEDLAKVLLTNGKCYASAFYSQQAVNKLSKSLVIYLWKRSCKTDLLIEKEGLNPFSC
ncbi:MAG: hypothetical protein OWQ50_00995 [Acidianus infernus]|nr:hypothetical protein [Acidianus infernus]